MEKSNLDVKYQGFGGMDGCGPREVSESGAREMFRIVDLKLAKCEPSHGLTERGAMTGTAQFILIF